MTMLLSPSKPVAFYSSSRRRHRLRPPRWLVLLLVGTGLGIGGVIFVQEKYLPPRISAAAGEQLRSSLSSSEVARAKQDADLTETSRRLAASLSERKQLADELADSRAAAGRLQEDLKAIVSTLPPDPRGGVVEIRAGRFVATGTSLNYTVVLSRGKATEAALPVSVQYVVSGDGARGASTVFTSATQAASVGSSSIQHGTLSLPDGLKPRQVAIRILDRSGGKSLGTRVLEVN
jgi:hypothetical protein